MSQPIALSQVQVPVQTPDLDETLEVSLLLDQTFDAEIECQGGKAHIFITYEGFIWIEFTATDGRQYKVAEQVLMSHFPPISRRCTSR